ncbi:MAG: hypothetical protein GY749_46805, partial [Desulfobacteraceae bacterium]|nr:hypothetical protein [Desulfobacteraceae bacterium]
MKIKIDPADTLFFRDGKPFTGGEETWADAIFPPYPPVIYGALRSKFFSVHITDLIKADEPNDPTSILKIKCIVLQSGKRLLFPMPLDCVKKKGDKSTSAFVLKTGERTETSNCPLENVLVAEKNTVAESVEDGLLDDIFLKSYL